MSRSDPRPTPTIAILGGGLSGATVAYALARMDLAARIVAIEPRARLGAGLAYSTDDPDHRLNVPDHKMTLRTDRLDDYARWLRRPGAPPIPADAVTSQGVFTARGLFGAYVADQLAPLLDRGRILHLRAHASDVVPKGKGFLIGLSDGTRLSADRIVLALTHPKPARLPALAALEGDARLVPDAMAPGALDSIGLTERVLVVGAGLTASDIAATLLRRGFAGQVTLVSRHGWRSKPHGPTQAETEADFAHRPAPTALALMQTVRQAVAADQARGLTWHATFDRLRAQGPAIWAALDEPERLRFLRHLRSLWDIHRFRIAPQTEAAVQALTLQGRLTHLAARLVAAAVRADALEVTLRLRHRAGEETLRVDRVILATGPHHASVIAGTPVLASLARLGLIGADPTRLGIATDDAACARPVRPGAEPGRILVAGPLARGTVGELMGVPEVVRWSEHVAQTLARGLDGAGEWIAAE